MNMLLLLAVISIARVDAFWTFIVPYLSSSYEHSIFVAPDTGRVWAVRTQSNREIKAYQLDSTGLIERELLRRGTLNYVAYKPEFRTDGGIWHYGRPARDYASVPGFYLQYFGPVSTADLLINQTKTASEVPDCFSVNAANEVVVAGTMASRRLFVRKFDAVGEMVFNVTFAVPTSNDNIVDVLYHPIDPSVVYVLGEITGAMPGTPGAAAVGTAQSLFLNTYSSGVLVASVIWGSASRDSAVGIVFDEAADILYAYGTTASTTTFDGKSADSSVLKSFLTAFTSVGSKLWSAIITNRSGSTRYANVTSATIASLGGVSFVVVAGETTGAIDTSATNAGKKDVFVARVSSDGSTITTNQYGTVEDETALAVGYFNGQLLLFGESAGNLFGIGAVTRSEQFVAQIPIPGSGDIYDPSAVQIRTIADLSKPSNALTSVGASESGGLAGFFAEFGLSIVSGYVVLGIAAFLVMLVPILIMTFCCFKRKTDEKNPEEQYQPNNPMAFGAQGPQIAFNGSDGLSQRSANSLAFPSYGGAMESQGYFGNNVNDYQQQGMPDYQQPASLNAQYEQPQSVNVQQDQQPAYGQEYQQQNYGQPDAYEQASDLPPAQSQAAIPVFKGGMGPSQAFLYDSTPAAAPVRPQYDATLEYEQSEIFASPPGINQPAPRDSTLEYQKSQAYAPSIANTVARPAAPFPNSVASTQSRISSLAGNTTQARF
eukprot:Partr_v1_DN28749_c2_g1_i2_m62832